MIRKCHRRIAKPWTRPKCTYLEVELPAQPGKALSEHWSLRQDALCDNHDAQMLAKSNPIQLLEHTTTYLLSIHQGLGRQMILKARFCQGVGRLWNKKIYVSH